ncbi:MAG: DMT family transporter [Synechococcaceae cyanobacterium]|nr:DMT family transporter [Synechococcaceae cyanobacterium]
MAIGMLLSRLGLSRWRLAPLALLGYVLLRGCDASVLKWLQERGAATLLRTAGAEDPISFSNVFFFANLATGLALVWLDKPRLEQQMSLLRASDRWIWAVRAGLGSLLGPISMFLALERLTVISQTLLFTLILPATALLARLLLREPLPQRFGYTLVLLPAGLLISRSMRLATPGGAAGVGLDPVGVAWAMVSVAAFAAAGVLNRVVADKGWGTGLTIGLSNLLAALVFGLITLVLFGPAQFLHLRWWWLMGVLLVYTAGISLGGELLLLFSYRDLGATTVALWGNAGVLVSLLSAHLLLGERLGPQTFVGAGLILAALLVGGSTLATDGQGREG